MRKLSLGKLKLASEEVLQRSQLAMIYGGSGSEPVMISCTCSTSGGGTASASCTEDLAGNGTNRCCSVHYGSNSQQSGTGCT
jgi:natural product precursor